MKGKPGVLVGVACRPCCAVNPDRRETTIACRDVDLTELYFVYNKPTQENVAFLWKQPSIQCVSVR